MPWFENALAAVAPEIAARRLAFRALYEHNKRAYEAAKLGRRTDGWRATGASANAEIAEGAARLRWRARDLARNNPYAVSALNNLADKVIGAGITPRHSTSDAKLKTSVRDWWNRFSDHASPEGQLDFYGLMHLASRAMFESGEVLVRLLPRPSSFSLKVPLQIELLESDYLDSSKTQRLPDGGAIVQGVEFDAFGRRVAYWLFDEHPGSDLPFGKSWQSKRWSAQQIIHVFDVLRPGQARGVSAFAASALRLRRVDDISDAKLEQQRIAACFAAFRKTAAGVAAGPLSGDGKGNAVTDSTGRKIDALSPGMIINLAAGDDIAFAVPPSTADYENVLIAELHAAAAGIGSTYQQMTGDLRQVNFSSIRAGMNNFWDRVDHWQWHVMIPQAHKPIWQAVIALGVAMGQLPMQYMPATWTPPKRRWVDPEAEVKAKTDEIRAGLTTLPEAIAESGEDPDEQLEIIAATNAKLDAAGIILDCDPRKVGKSSTPAVTDKTAKDKADAASKK